MPRKLLIRFLVIGLVVAGTLWWQRSKKPVDLTLAVDLTAMKPAEISGVDVIIRRGGRSLARHEMTFGKAGAPRTVEFVVRAPPGEAEVESTVNYDGKPSRRVTVKAELAEEGSNTIHPE
jgi:hypothetical protein